MYMQKIIYFLEHILCRCEHGVVTTCFGEGDLEMYEGVVALSVKGWKNERVLSLHEAAS